MSEQQPIQCPECDAMDGVDRRNFLATVGGTVVTLAALEAVPRSATAQQAAPAAQPAARTTKPAETLIRELYQGLSADQRRRVVMAWNQGNENNGIPLRNRIYNASLNQHKIGDVYTPAQTELNERILKAICADEEGFRRISRNGTWDNSHSFQNCGAHIFGDPSANGQFAWVFTGHHLTVRCDGNSEPNAGFGGPMYYGHSPDGLSQRNLFNYQTRTAQSVWNALNGAQREQATLPGNPGEPPPNGQRAEMIRFRPAPYPGIRFSDLTADQKQLVQQVMRDLLSPYRREDSDEVMDLVRRNGGMDRIHLGFYKDANAAADRWSVWRLEGPGFIWNLRVLPHVHCYVNIGVPAQPTARG